MMMVNTVILFQLGWPVTLHCDLGCDNYDAIPLGRDPANPLTGCEVPQKELRYTLDVSLFIVRHNDLETLQGGRHQT